MYRIFALIVFCLFINNVIQAQQQDLKDIRASFDGYKQAIMHDQGATAIEFLDSKTIQYYDSIAFYCNYADSLELEKLTIMDQMMVLIIRHLIPDSQLLDYNGYDLLLFAINKGLVGKDMVEHNDIGMITLLGNEAKAELLVNGNASNVYFNFFKEEDAWKLNLTTLFPMVNVTLEETINNIGIDRKSFFIHILKEMTGEMPSADLWHPGKPVPSTK